MSDDSGQSVPACVHVWERVSPVLELAGRAGSVMVGVTAGTQIMITLLLLIRRKTDPSLIAKLTTMGRRLYLPEYDIPIYLLSCLVTVIFACGLTWGMTRRAARLKQEHAGAYLISCLQRHLVLTAVAWVAFLAALRGVPSSTGPFSVESALMIAGPGLLCTVIALLGVLFDRGGMRLKGSGNSPQSAVSGIFPWGWVDDRERRWTERPTSPVLALGVVLGVVSVVAVPSCYHLAGKFLLEEQFHSWDFFVMGPTLRYLHGGKLGTEVYSQYGVGWPTIFAWLAPWYEVSYGNMLAVFVWLGVAYFVGVFLGLRWFLGLTCWATVGVFAAILGQIYLGTDPRTTIWMTPSSSVLRSPLDVGFFLSLLMHRRSGKPIWAGVAGAMTGAGLLLETDTGLYLCAVLIFYLACNGWWGPEPGRMAGLVGLSSMVLTLIVGLAVVSGGDLLHREFWTGWLEPLWLYSGGLSAMPFTIEHLSIFPAMSWTYVVLLSLLMTYLPEKRVGSGLILGGCVSAYGLCLLLQFVNRSHYWNLYHACVPFCTIWAAWLAGGQSLLKLKKPQLRAEVWACPLVLALVLAALVSHPGFHQYPHVWNHLSTGEPPKSLTFMPGVSGLSMSYSGNVEEFRAVTRVMSQLRAAGRTVGVLDPYETPYYLGSGCPPQGRYTSPVLQIIRKDQLTNEEQQLAALGLNTWLILNRLPSSPPGSEDVFRELANRLTQGYTRVNEVGAFGVWQRTPSKHDEIHAR